VIGCPIVLVPGASGLSFVWSFSSNHSLCHIWHVRITHDDIFTFAFIGRPGPNQDFLLVGTNVVTGIDVLSIFTS
jgi:hypothetical protein